MTDKEPDSFKSIVALSRPRRGDPPARLSNPRNYLVFDRLTSDGDYSREVGDTADEQGHLAIDDPGRVLGIVIPPVQPVRPEELAAELLKVSVDTGSSREGAALIPDWTALGALPPVAPPSPARWLVRRSGAKVRAEWVIPPDNRTPYYPDSYPFSIVGRLFVWDDATAPIWATSGTASLLGDRTILTASHMVPWNSGSNWKALFIPAYWDGASLFGSGAVSWVTNAQGYPDHAQGDDMAVMRLAEPLGASLGYFGFKTYTDDWEDLEVWTLPGYPGDKDDAQRPWMHLNFPIIDDDDDGAGVELEYRADAYHGQSGAPIFAWFDGAPYIVGTHSGGEDNPGEPTQNVAAGGSALTNLLHWARATWP